MATVATGIRAPAGSVTDPAIALVVSPCAIASRAMSCVKSKILGTPKLYNGDVPPTETSREREGTAPRGPYNTESVDDYLKAILELGGAEEQRVTSNALAQH